MPCRNLDKGNANKCNHFYDLPREFNVVGSCVFHKGFLIASHLNAEDMVDVRMWCDFSKLLRDQLYKDRSSGKTDSQ